MTLGMAGAWIVFRVRALAMVVVFVACGLAPELARGDVASDVAADLAHPASGVSVRTVTVAAPTGLETQLGPNLNAHVTINAPDGGPLSGILPPPGIVNPWTSTLADLVKWDLATFEAVKHAQQRGAVIDSISFDRYYPGDPSESGVEHILNVTPVDTPVVAPPSISLTTIRQAALDALPPWVPQPQVTVQDDAVGERVISVTFSLPVPAFRLFDVSSTLDALVGVQQNLADEGGYIGRVLVRVNRTDTNEPLYAGGADSLYGFGREWHAPLVAPLYGSPGQQRLDQQQVHDAPDSIVGTSPIPLG